MAANKGRFLIDCKKVSEAILKQKQGCDQREQFIPTDAIMILNPDWRLSRIESYDYYKVTYILQISLRLMEVSQFPSKFLCQQRQNNANTCKVTHKALLQVKKIMIQRNTLALETFLKIFCVDEMKPISHGATTLESSPPVVEEKIENEKITCDRSTCKGRDKIEMNKIVDTDPKKLEHQGKKGDIPKYKTEMNLSVV